jgi:N-sulfoglucosamine sulfohydrolase
LPRLVTACNDPHPVIRYWGATGCLILQEKSAPAKAKLEELLRDDWMDIRVVAAEALSYLGQTDVALVTLEPIIKGEQEYPALAAMNALDYMQQAGHISLERIHRLLGDAQFKGNLARMAEYFAQRRMSASNL